MIRDELAQTIGAAMDAFYAGCIEGMPTASEGAADAVLAYLGRMDPDCDPELIALHLRDSRAEIARLRDVIAYMAGLHYETDGVCVECGKPWVCDTRARAASVEYPAETGREQ